MSRISSFLKHGITTGTKPVHVAQCKFCGRVIVKEEEPQERYHVVNGKPMCGVCRATKLSRFSRVIMSPQKKREHDMDKQRAEVDGEKMESKRIDKIASESVKGLTKDIKK
ncbi:MAG: hypothetical protein KAS04_01220 [Candidatus Aenigmarchaeota archaeon]|nr:hypothetical protein [Candidatus Aenigmarchaeota archaeon]